ncbi:MAG: sigma-70 family RNA polymerase sigma factor [Planctomycetes bacterium]|nr:sigma-70 family RNA polymerase sigma factor [Planctomycetota bacterium]
MGDPSPRRREDSTELVARVRADAPGAWARLVRRYERLVLSVPRGMGLSEDDCEEVFQATWMALHRQIHGLRDPGSLGDWIITTARRQAWKHLRRTSLRRQREGASLPSESEAGEGVRQEPASPDAPPIDEVLRLERRQIVHEVLEGMPTRCRRLLEALYLGRDDPSYAEVARRLGMPIGSLGPTRARCLAELARRLEEAGLS